MPAGAPCGNRNTEFEIKEGQLSDEKLWDLITDFGHDIIDREEIYDKIIEHIFNVFENK